MEEHHAIFGSKLLIMFVMIYYFNYKQHYKSNVFKIKNGLFLGAEEAEQTFGALGGRCVRLRRCLIKNSSCFKCTTDLKIENMIAHYIASAKHVTKSTKSMAFSIAPHLPSLQWRLAWRYWHYYCHLPQYSGCYYQEQ